MAYEVTEADVEILREMKRWKESMSGDGLSNAPSSASFSNTSAATRGRRRSRAALPTPQYPGMFLGSTVANQVGYSYIAAIDSIVTT